LQAVQAQQEPSGTDVGLHVFEAVFGLFQVTEGALQIIQAFTAAVFQESQGTHSAQGRANQQPAVALFSQVEQGVVDSADGFMVFDFVCQLAPGGIELVDRAFRHALTLVLQDHLGAPVGSIGLF
jgi:hypothetical protein